MSKRPDISYRLVAYTDPAGKCSPLAPRNGNEDNFYVDFLMPSSTKGIVQDEVIKLGELGLLMVVADGMGGMNAGEVASQIAVDTVRKCFEPDALDAGVTDCAQTRQAFLEWVIKVADREIKNEAKKTPDYQGMGTTIIMAWLYGDQLTISWCGDSRAYIFNEESGIRLVSRDHSYVQELVNDGLLTYDQTFDHPQNNIITRSLGDPSSKAMPESKTIRVGKGDIILLCSDGLTGVLRDRKTYGPDGKPYPENNLEDIIRAHTGSMKECREALWKAAEEGGWYDNVTAVLCQITDGPESQWRKIKDQSRTPSRGRKGSRKSLYVGLGLLVIMALAACAFFLWRPASSPQPDPVAAPADSLSCQSALPEGEVKEVPQEEVSSDETKALPEPEEVKAVQKIEEKVKEKASSEGSKESTIVTNGNKRASQEEQQHRPLNETNSSRQRRHERENREGVVKPDTFSISKPQP